MPPARRGSRRPAAGRRGLCREPLPTRPRAPASQQELLRREGVSLVDPFWTHPVTDSTADTPVLPVRKEVAVEDSSQEVPSRTGDLGNVAHELELTSTSKILRLPL